MNDNRNPGDWANLAPGERVRVVNVAELVPGDRLITTSAASPTRPWLERIMARKYWEPTTIARVEHHGNGDVTLTLRSGFAMGGTWREGYRGNAYLPIVNDADASLNMRDADLTPDQQHARLRTHPTRRTK